jgi:hypothetical protein
VNLQRCSTSSDPDRQWQVAEVIPSSVEKSSGGGRSEVASEEGRSEYPGIGEVYDEGQRCEEMGPQREEDPLDRAKEQFAADHFLRRIGQVGLFDPPQKLGRPCFFCSPE